MSDDDDPNPAEQPDEPSTSPADGSVDRPAPPRARRFGDAPVVVPTSPDGSPPSRYPVPPYASPCPPARDGLPMGKPASTRQQKKVLAHAIQERVQADLLVSWYMAIARGHAPYIRVDKHGLARVVWDKNEINKPTLAERNAAIDQLKKDGYGLPVQNIALQANMRIASAPDRVDQLGISPWQAAALRDVVRGVLASGGGSASVIDAESSEYPASNGDDPEGESPDPEPLRPGELAPASACGDPVLRRRPEPR